MEEWRIFRLNHDSAKRRANKRNTKLKFHTELPTRDGMLNKQDPDLYLNSLFMITGRSEHVLTNQPTNHVAS
jgi:hypothetical protein